MENFSLPVFMSNSDDVPMGLEFLSVGVDVAGYFHLPNATDPTPIIVRQISDSEFRAFSAICPHRQCTVEIMESSLRCPCHGSQFDLSTGQVTLGPASSDLEPLQVSIENNVIVVSKAHLKN